jgi:tetratricopeptide (TPR) repeat protein
LWHALTYQQTDQSMEPEWFDLLRSLPDAGNMEDPPALLLLAWRGLLWLPPESEGKTSAEIIDFDRIEKGLLAFAETVQGQEEAENLLHEALEILRDTFPRSGEFWEEHLRPRIGSWPRELRESAAQIWPGLQSFLWQFPMAAEQGSLSLYWRSVGEHLDAQSPLEALFAPDTASFWDDVDIKDCETYSRKIQNYLHSRQALRDSIEAPKTIRLLIESPTDVQLFTGSLLLYWTDPKPDLIRLEGGTALVCPCQREPLWRKDWRVLEPLPSLTRFSFEEADIEQFRPKTFAFQQELAHQAVMVLAGCEHVERWTAEKGAAFRQIERYALELRRALVPEISSAMPSSIAAIEAAMAQLVQQRSTIAGIPGLQPSTSLHLSFAGPAPERYLRDLAALPATLKAAALDQLRRALQSAWNPLERLYLQAITTLMALQEEDFLRALQELDALRRASSILTVEHQVLKLHAKAGAGARKASVQLFKALEQQELAKPVQKTLDLLDDAFGLSGRETVPDPEQHEEIIRQEAAMIEAASSLSPAA